MQLNQPDTHAVQMSRGGVDASQPMLPDAMPPNGGLNSDPILGSHPHIDTVGPMIAPLIDNSGAGS